MNGYPNGHDDPNADEGEEYGYEDHREGADDGYGEDESEAEARRQAEAYHAQASRHSDKEDDETEDGRYASDDRPRESRKERRRREAAERQARAEAEAAALANRGAHEPARDERVQAAAVEASSSAVVAETAEKSGKFGRWFGKRSGEDRMGENRSGAPQIEIVLPSSDRIDPNALTEFGLDPNTLAAMGMDPATLPQFEPEFLVELGINPQIVVEILRRQKLAEMGMSSKPAAPVVEHGEEFVEDLAEAVGEASKRKFDMSPAAWIARYRKFQKWAPAAAAATGLTTTGSIWFMSGGEPEKPVEQVKNEQLAGEKAESALGEAIAKDEEPGIAPTEVADAGKAESEPPKAEPAPTDPAAEPVSLAMNDLPTLPATPVGGDPAPGDSKPADGLPALPAGEPSTGLNAPDIPAAAGTTEAPPGLNTPDAPPGLPPDSLPGLPAEQAPPGIPGNEPPPGLPATEAANADPAAPPTEASKNATGQADEKSGLNAKALALPAIGGLGAAAALAGSKAGDAAKTAADIGKPGDGMPELPKTPDAVPAEAPPGIPAPANEAPPVNETPGANGSTAPADDPPGLPSTSEPLPSPTDGPGLSIPNASDAAKSAPDAGSTVPKTAAGVAVGLGAGLAAESLKSDSAPAGSLDIPKAGTEAAIPPNDPPAAAATEPPAERPPGIGPTSEPPGSLSGLPSDIPQTPSAPGGDSNVANKAKPREADASWPSIPNGRGKLLRSLANSAPTGAGLARSAAVATAGAGAGLALGAAISNGSPSGGSVQVESMPPLDTAPPDIAPIRHTVQSGENFWTISRDYYGSGRYFKALWAANAARIGKIDELHVGDVVQIPAMENLDKSLIESSNVAKSKRAGNAPANEETPEVARSRDARAVRTRNEIESVPIGGEPGQKPARKVPAMPEPANPKEIVSQPVGETASTAGYIRHRVRPGDTLRTIAADRLGNARRANEIVELNPDVLDDVRTPLEPDMILMLPRGEKEE